ncbi:cell division protein FtsQ/DivIB [Sphingomicrobium lutaoense]|uniref:Cell division protein FtsQ n=1 Tax=Sphingomicrobium lutaoense TaxID=515949 RepID=A0A839Z421_9SPHN|nr:FtsQ-type POTRA domain-containing protein [Sphingomicrobium lutaoense]MBB3764352.1 cell division protein FtsQ [Sphingomicrobium lutaoense]
MSAKHVKRSAPKRRSARRTRKAAPRKNAAGGAQAGADRVARFAFFAFAAVIGIAILFALDLPGKAARAAGEGVGSMGFRVKSVDVQGIERMDPEPVYRIALNQRTTALPLVDTSDVRRRLLDFGWVHDARVSRRYPDTLVIDIVEREPAALWQDDGRLMLIDAEGRILDRVPISEMPDLPLLLGPGAPANYAQLARILDREPALKSQLASARWVGRRRWDLNVTSGEILVLPEGEKAASEALASFMKNDRANPLLGLGVKRYDLRIPGQAIARMPGPVEELRDGGGA